jgi:replicative DNA helicase
LEQDADCIVFLWRGEYYDITEYEDGTPTADTVLFDST